MTKISLAEYIFFTHRAAAGLSPASAAGRPFRYPAQGTNAGSYVSGFHR